MKRLTAYIIALYICIGISAKIDRKALVTRNNPHVTSIDTLASLSVGNGGFAFTCDITGLQTFHNLYALGVPLGSMSEWGWHSFPNDSNYLASEVLSEYDFGRGHKELYSCQLKDARGKAAADYLRANPHRLNLGVVGFKGMRSDDITDIDQTLDLWNGKIISNYKCNGKDMRVTTACHPEQDIISAEIYDTDRHPVELRFPYPTGKHSDNACDWSEGHNHQVRLVSKDRQTYVFAHTIDAQTYYIKITCSNASRPIIEHNTITIKPSERSWSIGIAYYNDVPDTKEITISSIATEAQQYWNNYWTKGAAVDFSLCTDSRAKELERRVVLSQYLLAIQCAGHTPPQETGLTYNSWFGKYHLEMIWWHQAHFALWGHPEMLARTLPWYFDALPMAQEIAKRQGFDGARWMKMTDPSAAEAPSNVGSFLIWQQPHIIYLCELLYRSTNDRNVLTKYAKLVDETARFMASFATYDKASDRYILKGCIPAQETLKASETVNPPFELSYWHFALSIAQLWRSRLGLAPMESWSEIIDKLSPLCAKDGVYAAAETALSYPTLKPAASDNSNEPFEASELPQAVKFYSDHMAVLAACGVLPQSSQCDVSTMSSTLHWVMNNWNWDKTWGWDFPTTCMTAVRTGEPEIALDALLKDCRTNTYLPNGHNYQDSRLRCYLPGNGGLLTAVALMCRGYDGCPTDLPGFPKDGKWNVQYEGLNPMP